MKAIEFIIDKIPSLKHEPIRDMNTFGGEFMIKMMEDYSDYMIKEFIKRHFEEITDEAIQAYNQSKNKPRKINKLI